MIPVGNSQAESRFSVMKTWTEETFSRLTAAEILHSAHHCERLFPDVEMLKPLLG